LSRPTRSTSTRGRRVTELSKQEARRRWWWATALAALLAIVFGFAWYVQQGWGGVVAAVIASAIFGTFIIGGLNAEENTKR